MTPPPIKIGPPLATGKKNGFDRFVATHPGLKQYKTSIQQWAGEYGVPALYLAAVIWKESKGVNADWNPAVQGSGIAQLNIDPQNHNQAPGSVNQVLGRPLTYADAKNPDTSIQVLAYAMAKAQSQGYTDADSFYTHVWNPNFAPTKTSPLPSAYLKGYTVTVTGHTAAQTAAGAVAVSAAKRALTDPWVVVTPSGALKTIKSDTPPKNAVKDATGQAYTLSQFNMTRRSLDAIYLAWTGHTTPAKAVAAYIRNPISDPGLQMRLSDPAQNPRLYKSPIWLTHAPDYESVYKSVYGNDAKPPVDVLRFAIVHNLSQVGFQQKLRDQPDYNTSEEYKGAAAQFRSGYQQIYGQPDAVGEQAIDKAVRTGLNGDQWMQTLRNQPEYTGSGEFQRNALALAHTMALIPGAQTTGVANA